ncbi:MAG TPA: hypothetical protein VFD13_07235 [Candidatus Kapabacteria bacterium]|nr:hypothetical protein [Candidatus Kapabacteria bacterium]
MKTISKSKLKPLKTGQEHQPPRRKESLPGSSYEAFKRLEKWVEGIPEEVFANVPDDASMRYEEYLYGSDH